MFTRLKLIRNAPGPAPWYWNTFPAITGERGTRFNWSMNPQNYNVYLRGEGEDPEVRLVVGTYTRVFALPGGVVGLWYPINNRLHLLAYEAERLPAFTIEGISPVERMSFCLAQPLFRMELDGQLPEGDYAVEIPEALRALDELLLVIERDIPTRDDPAQAILSLRPRESRLRVYPQRWITANEFDLGYQWITRVVRDPRGGRLLGDGIRIGPFALSEDGCELDHWLRRIV